MIRNCAVLRKQQRIESVLKDMEFIEKGLLLEEDCTAPKCT
jgi:hypothetical protein